jgi:hypothetical protein
MRMPISRVRIDADDREQQRDAAEHHEQPCTGVDRPQLDAAVAMLFERLDRPERDGRIGGRYLPPKRLQQ